MLVDSSNDTTEGDVTVLLGDCSVSYQSHHEFSVIPVDSIELCENVRPDGNRMKPKVESGQNILGSCLAGFRDRSR